jgi:hypothetical protein
MSVQETTEIRELTAHELGGVAGGWYSALIAWAVYGSENNYGSEVDTGKRLQK